MMRTRLSRENVLDAVKAAAAVSLARFSLYSAIFGVFQDMVQKGTHLSIVLLIVVLASCRRSAGESGFLRSFVDFCLMAGAFAVVFYHVVYYEAVANRWGELTEQESWLAIGCSAALLEATRRAIGRATLEGSGVEKLADLKGKRVGMGQPGGVSMLDADMLLDHIGLKADSDFEPFRVRLGAMANMLGDGQLDAALWNGSFPLPPVIKLGSQHPVKPIPIPDDVFETLNAKVPPYFRNEIPGDSYKGIPEAVRSYGLANGLVIDADVDEDLVYRMTKAIYENLAGLKGVHPAFGGLTKATVLNGFGAPLHPGALRFYREIEVPGIEEFVNRTAD